MFHDRYDLPISTASPLAAARYVEGVDRLLSLNAGAGGCFAAAIAADGEFALAHAALALASSSEGRLEAGVAGLARARSLAGSLSPREQGHVAAVAAILGEDEARAVARIRAQLAAYPREALLLRHAGTLLAFSGRQDWPQAVSALYTELRDSYGDDWWYLGAAAMALQECDRFAEACRHAERSLARYPRNAMAAHALAHVLHATGNDIGVRQFLGRWLAGYDRQAPFHCHLSWHLALAELAGGRVRASLDRYERDIRPVLQVRPATALVDAASLLWRHRLRGTGEGAADQALPWGDVAAVATSLAARPGFAFLDVHSALTLAAAGEETALGTLVDGLRRLATQGHAVAETVALPLALGLSAFAAGDNEEAIRRIGPIAGSVVRLGGSNAQREVIEETLLAAYLGAGRPEEAEALWRERASGREEAGRGDVEGFAWRTTGDPFLLLETIGLDSPARSDRLAYVRRRLGELQ
jgi:tetratricopeptide (TPR) repeat protein